MGGWEEKPVKCLDMPCRSPGRKCYDGHFFFFNRGCDNSQCPDYWKTYAGGRKRKAATINIYTTTAEDAAFQWMWNEYHWGSFLFTFMITLHCRCAVGSWEEQKNAVRSVRKDLEHKTCKRAVGGWEERSGNEHSFSTQLT